MALPSVADCWAPAGRTAHACGEAVSREAGLSPPWLRASSMLKFSPRLGGCSKILKAVGHFGSSFSVVEAMRSSKDCLRFQNPFCFAGLLFRVSRETVKEVGPGSMRYCGWTDGNVSVQLSLRGPSLGNSICHSLDTVPCPPSNSGFCRLVTLSWWILTSQSSGSCGPFLVPDPQSHAVRRQAVPSPPVPQRTVSSRGKNTQGRKTGRAQCWL